MVCCSTVGFRSGKYAQQLMEEGFNVKNFKGSIIAWVRLQATVALLMRFAACSGSQILDEWGADSLPSCTIVAQGKLRKCVTSFMSVWTVVSVAQDSGWSLMLGLLGRERPFR